MKRKILTLIMILAATLLIPFRAFATGGFSVSTSSITLYPGDTTTFSVTATNAAGRLNLTTSNSAVASLSASSIFPDNSSETITVTAGSVGSATITVAATSDFATYDEEILAGQTYTIAVTVVARPDPTPDPTPESTPEPESNSQNNYQPTTTTETVVETETAVETEETEDTETLENVETSTDDSTQKAENAEKLQTSQSANTNASQGDTCETRALVFMLIAIAEGIALLVILMIFLIKKIKKNRKTSPSNIEIKPL